MREILFRGKRVATGEWATSYNPNATMCCGVEREAFDWKTVGQYTGMKDINDKRIFEGDIVSFKRVNALGYTTSRIGDVRYYDALPIFYIMATTGDAWDWVDCEEITVIGNIHDNPDLLEG